MFGYYLDLALRSLKRNKMLTALMVVTLGVGIGACITTMTVLKLLSGDPLPQKSARLFYPKINYHDAANSHGKASTPEPTMSYLDAMALLRAHKAKRQAAMAMTAVKVMPVKPGLRPFFTNVMMTTADFFDLFDAPFEYGSGWSSTEGAAGAPVVVIADYLNRKLFGGIDSVGRTLRMGSKDYRIIGVLRPWAPQPRFYALYLGGHSYGQGDAVFMPLETAVDVGLQPENELCFGQGDFSKLKTAPCRWLAVWVELASAGQAGTYRQFLSNYVQQQITAGRLHNKATALPNLMQFLTKAHVVPADAQIEAYVAFGFLLICVVNTVGLLLAKCLKRKREIGVRRALGASRRAIFAQFLTEAAIIGVAGGVLGLGLTFLGLWAVRQQPADYAKLAHLDLAMFVFTFVVALVASLIAGLLPAWRACVVAPAPQLKSI
ncbi:MAG TPA: FtsX-like permease family protein [Rhodanobacteraceae bacterium]